MTAPSAQERKACWDARDEYWRCLDDNSSDVSKCEQFRKGFESHCPRTWIKYFDKRRDYLKYKADVESKGFEPLKTEKDS
ncbi:cytochrome c oxidase assembly factor 6 homolog [Hyperolius riggenbachi]|uniref:cytochrome c oxidase assembly factor 6 homolog n=1 Tax=Hyperolius riggenbachi TaxID=752182 RepID=UPI0035A30933